MTLNKTKAASLVALALLSTNLYASDTTTSAQSSTQSDAQTQPAVTTKQDPGYRSPSDVSSALTGSQASTKDKTDATISVLSFKKTRQPSWSAQQDQDKFVPEDLWGRLRGGFAMQDLDSPLVSSSIRAYTSHQENLTQSTQRASKYLYHVLSEVERRNMPTELALLPFVESSFDPDASSPANATGIWQFMPATATTFKLKRNVFKDERRDIVASTNAALDYLQYLYNIFGDWHLALAAYNWGEGSVQKLIRSNRAAGNNTDYASLSSQMPAETRNYVPRLLAYKAIVTEPGRYGVSLPALSNAPYFSVVEKSQDMDVNVAAKLAEMPLNEFRALNPQFNRPVITGSDSHILVPATRAETFRTNLTNWKQRLSSWTVHTVSSAKDRIEAIAQRFGTTPERLRAVNDIPARMEASPGSTLLVPKMAASLSGDTEIRADVVDNSRLGFAYPVDESRSRHRKTGAGHRSRYRSRE